MMDQIFDLNNWQLRSIDEQMESIDKNIKKNKKKGHQLWRNTNQSISPLVLYEYLKTRFGAPNGFIMALKNRSSDNLIHWHYSLKADETIINIFGKTSGLEILIKPLPDFLFSEKDWQTLVNNFQTDFKKYRVEMKNVKSEFEEWSLFINPFNRIEHTIKNYICQLEKLNLKEVENYAESSKKSFGDYTKELNRWVNNIEKAASLGTTIRMLCPVMVESFINLVILVFRKEEFKNDERHKPDPLWTKHCHQRSRLGEVRE